MEELINSPNWLSITIIGVLIVHTFFVLWDETRNWRCRNHRKIIIGFLVTYVALAVVINNDPPPTLGIYAVFLAIALLIPFAMVLAMKKPKDCENY